MSKVAKGLGAVAGIAALGLSFLVPGGQLVLGVAASKLATIMSGVSVGAGAIAQATASRPISTPAPTDIILGAEQPYPYAMGRCKIVGNMVHTEAHGREREDIPNPWRTDTYVLTGAGPVQSIDQILVNGNALTFNASNAGQASGYYSKYLRGTTQLGALSEGVINTFGNDGAPPTFNYWNSSRRISGMAAMQFSMLLDSKETHFRSGPPDFAAVGRWVKAYDARLDSSVSGGSGSHRIDDETTFTYHTNPAMLALTYAYGRYQNSKPVCGGGLSVNAIDVQSFIDAANVQDANGWETNGIVYENGEDGEIWNNLKQILEAGGAWPTNDGGVLRCMQQASRVVLDTVTDEDLEGPCSTPGMTRWRDGFNTIIPRYVSEYNQWTLVSSDAVGVPTLVTAQGEVRSKSRDYALVTDKDQAAALGVYAIYDSVELSNITLTVGRRFINFDVGDALALDIPSLGLDHTGVITNHSIDVTTGRVTLTLTTDTDAKHAYALSRTGTAPEHPSLVSEDELDIAADAAVNVALRAQNISTSHVTGLASPITVEPQGNDWLVTVPAHKRVYPDAIRFEPVDVDETSVVVTQDDTSYYLHYDDEDMGGGAVALAATTDSTQAVTSDEHTSRHYVGWVVTEDGNEGVPATSPTVVPPRVPTSDTTLSVGDLTADEILSRIPNITAEAISEVTDGLAVARSGVGNIIDTVRGTTATAVADVRTRGNFDFSDGFTGWISDGNSDLFAPWPTTVTTGELGGFDDDGQQTTFSKDQAANIAAVILDGLQTSRTIS